ncbi:peptidoglycan-binding protein [Streptomyces sp. NPDC058239]|uniref:peptidoglycan-binding domain-containing protein n=1 Tax=Streptomyces sp. NPDC058239 TaxID=3346395 RepID=UPI0036DFE1D5
MRLSLLASAVLAAALLPVGSASAALATPATAQAPTAVAVNCRDTVDGLYCGYDLSDDYTDRGDSGAKVKELQALLIYRGYSVGSTGVDGYFGAATESAVKRFQTAEKITADGIVGPTTWYRLRSTA